MVRLIIPAVMFSELKKKETFQLVSGFSSDCRRRLKEPLWMLKGKWRVESNMPRTGRTKEKHVLLNGFVVEM